MRGVPELTRYGCPVECLDRPMRADPHDQLLLQIRGAVAEYERSVIAKECAAIRTAFKDEDPQFRFVTAKKAHQPIPHHSKTQCRC